MDPTLLPGWGAAVSAALAAELAARRTEVVAIDARLAGPVDRLIEFTTVGGKRLRPLFLALGWAAANADDPHPPPQVVRAAAALELIQACALLHDDLIDRSDTRRGRPSAHRAIGREHADAGAAGDAAHYGVSVALLLGDLALAWADDLFTDAAAAAGRLPDAGPPWRAMRTEVLAGQLLDLETTARPAPDPATARADAVQVNRFKTAAYTVERPLHLGAALGGAAAPVVSALRAYGTAVGLAFQLRDDLLGIFGDPAVTGKPAGDDLVEGKRTVLLADTRSALAAADLAAVDAAVGSPMPVATLARVRELITRSGAVDRSEELIGVLLDDARAALDGANPQAPAVPEPARGALLAVADQAVRRTR